MVSSGSKALLIMSCFNFLIQHASSKRLCCAKGEHGSFTSFKLKKTCEAGRWKAGHDHEVDEACCSSRGKVGASGAIPVINSPCNKEAIPGAPCPGSAAARWRKQDPGGKNLVCCCKSFYSIGQDPALSCPGDANGDAPYIFHPGLKEQTPAVLGVSQTCHPGHLNSFCCHTFEGTHCKAAAADTFTQERKQYFTHADASLCFSPPPTPNSGNTADPHDKTPQFLKTLAARPNQHNGAAGASKAHLSGRDYTIIIDRGSLGYGPPFPDENVAVPDKIAQLLHLKKGSQKMTRWKQVEVALQFLAPFVAAEDPDGVSLYFFSDSFSDAGVFYNTGICTAADAHDLFQENKDDFQFSLVKHDSHRTSDPKLEKTLEAAMERAQAILVLLFDRPRDEHIAHRLIGSLGPDASGPRLTKTLEAAMEPDTLGRAQAILVLLFGSPRDGLAVIDAIKKQTDKMCDPNMLSISFIQVGTDGDGLNDRNTAEYFRTLDSKLQDPDSGAKFDIVDHMTAGEMDGKSFLEVIAESLSD